MQGTLAVISQSGQTLSFFDIASGSRTGCLIDLIAESHELCHDKKRQLLYVSHTYRHRHFWAHGDYAHEISVIDCAAKACIDVISVYPALGPHGLAIDEQKDLLYVSVEKLEAGGEGSLVAIELQSRTVAKSIESQFKPHWFGMTLDGRKAYTCNKTPDFVSVLDLDNDTLIGKIDLPSTEEPEMSLDGKFAYFPTPCLVFGVTPENASVQVIDTATDRKVSSFPTGLSPQAVKATPMGLLVGKHRFDSEAPAETLKA